MDWTEDIRAALSGWRKHAKALRELGQLAEQRPATAALAFDLVAEELGRRGLIDLYYYGVALPQSRYARRLEAIEDRETEARRRSHFYETYYGDPKKYEELAAQGV